MATEKLQIVLDANWRGGNAIRQADQEIGGLATKATRNWGSVAKGIGAATLAIGAVGVAAGQAYKMLGEGAGLVKARDQFDRLSVSINSTGDAMLGKLRSATSGLMTDAELVANAGRIMSLGLQDTEDGVARLTSVASQLNWDLSTLILTMANDSTMRLDSLGLSIEDVTNRAAKLKAAGMDASSAFDLAVIEAGEEKVRLLGDAADTTAGQMKIMETAVGNATDAFKTELATSFAGGLMQISGSALQAASDLEVLTGALGRFFGALGGAVVGGLATGVREQSAYSRAIELGLISANARAVDLQGVNVPGLVRGYDARMAASRGTNANYGSGRAGGAISSSSMFDYGAVATDRTTGFRGMGATDPRTSALWREYERYAGVQGVLQTQGLKTAQVLREQEAALTGGGGGGGGGLASALRDSAEAMSQLSAESGDLFSRLRGAKEFNLAEELFSLGDKMGAGALDLAQFGVTAGLFDQARADELLGQSYMLQNAEQMLAQGMSLQEVWAAVQGQQANASALATEFFSTIDQTSAEATLLLETQPGYDELDAFVSAVETANPVMTVTANFPSIPGGPAPEPRAIGGPVYGGEPYIVGERGPELFVPSGNGRIIPNGQGGGGGMTVNINNREAAAMFLTNTGLARRAGLDRRMGVA